jgi:hypothetical protein
MTIIHRIARDPAGVTALFTAIVAVLLLFDIVELTEVQTGALAGVLAAVLLFIRMYATPVSDPILAIGTTVNASSDLPTATVVALDQDEA